MNPSFPLTVEAAKAALRQMMANPKPLARPLVILDGYLDPHIAAAYLRRTFIRLSGNDRRVRALSFLVCGRFQSCGRKVIRHVDRQFPSDDPIWTQELDVIGFSMGGLIGRYAAAAQAPAQEHRRLKIARLFTIATPHCGADMARLPAPTRLQRDMRAGSSFLVNLGEATKEADYPVYPYVRLRDRIVGAPNTALQGPPWWVPNRPGQPAHLLAFCDPRILADIARRLRGEQPFTRQPPAPLPPD